MNRCRIELYTSSCAVFIAKYVPWASIWIDQTISSTGHVNSQEESACKQESMALRMAAALVIFCAIVRMRV